MQWLIQDMMQQQARVHTDSKILFSRLAKTKFQGFPGQTKLVFKDFPGYFPFTNMVVCGIKSAHTKSVVSVTALQ